MKKKIFLAVMALMSLSFLVLDCATKVDAHTWEYETDGFIYQQSRWSVPLVITGYAGVAKEVIIPGGFKIRRENFTREVVAIKKGAFEGKQLTSVVIPGSVTVIDANAFSGNNLTNIVMPANVNVAQLTGDIERKAAMEMMGMRVIDDAFDNNFAAYYYAAKQAAGTYTYDGNGWALDGIALTLAAVPTQAAAGTEVTQVVVPAEPVIPPDEEFEVTQNKDGKTLTISGYKGSATNIIIPATLYGLPVTVIGNDAFARKGLTGVVIPDSVTTIGVRAFRENQLTSVILGNKVTVIEASAFADNKLNSVTIPNSVTSLEGFKNNQLTSIILGNSVAIIGEDAFRNNQLTSITIPDSVITIENGAFYNNKLTSLILGKRVTTIKGVNNYNYSYAKGAFANNQLASLTIPDSVTTIGGQTFEGNKLTSLTLGRGLNSIEYYAFRNAFNNDQLSSITIAKDVRKNGNDDAGLNTGFPEGFINFYESQGRKPGTYVKNGPIWSKK
jgi:hypothetical protein